MAKKWMKAAFANSHGQFKAKAEAAGESTEEYARKHAHAEGKLGKQARLALVGMGKDVPGPPKAKSTSERMKSRYGNG